ncbi:MAG: electron transport complex subunit E [Spirochaetales bacterium]
MSFKDHVLVRNPVFGLGVGIFPVLALSYRFDTAWIAGVLSILLILLGKGTYNLVKEAFPASILMYARIAILAFWVALLEILLEAYVPRVRDSLGIYLPLLAVNTFILGTILPAGTSKKIDLYGSLLFGLGYLITIGSMGAVREILGSGTLTLLSWEGGTFQYGILPPPMQPIRFFVLPAGGLILYGYLKAGFRYLILRLTRKPNEEAP